MKIIYEPNLVTILATRNEAAQFVANFQVDGAVMQGDTDWPEHRYVLLRSIRIAVIPSGLLKISVQRDEVTFAADAQQMGVLAHNVGYFVSNSPLDIGYHLENLKDGLGFQKESLSLILIMVAE